MFWEKYGTPGQIDWNNQSLFQVSTVTSPHHTVSYFDLILSSSRSRSELVRVFDDFFVIHILIFN